MDRISALERRLQRLEDERDITALFNAYAFHFDRNEPEAVADLFTEDATIDYGPEVELISGRSQIARRIASGLTNTFSGTSHHISNVAIEFSDDVASGVAYVYAWHQFVDGSRDGHLWAQYHNEFRRADEGWKISRLVLRAAGTESFHRANMRPIGRRAELT